jgi:hypothetical protein
MRAKQLPQRPKSAAHVLMSVCPDGRAICAAISARVKSLN